MERQVGAVTERPFKMVLAPPRGERECGRNETAEEESVILGKENKKMERSNQ